MGRAEAGWSSSAKLGLAVLGILSMVVLYLLAGLAGVIASGFGWFAVKTSRLRITSARSVRGRRARIVGAAFLGSALWLCVLKELDQRKALAVVEGVADGWLMLLLIWEPFIASWGLALAWSERDDAASKDGPAELPCWR